MGDDGIVNLVKEAQEAARQAYAPYSGYKVGCAIESADGEVYRGCNVENVSFGATLCAERVALGTMVSAGKRHIARIVVATPDGNGPCGICLQALSEFVDESTTVTTVGNNVVEVTRPFHEFLPFGFASRAVKRTERS